MCDLDHYVNPTSRLARMVKSGEYIPIVRGLYETDPDTPGYLLAGSIYGPSYLSFDYALGYYGMIPEAVYAFTSATYDKKKRKTYETPFGRFTYRDVPKEVYPLGVCLLKEGDYAFQIASPEKALCDKLYELPPVGSIRGMTSLLIQDLRIEPETLRELSREDIRQLQKSYHSTNVDLLLPALRKINPGS